MSGLSLQIYNIWPFGDFIKIGSLRNKIMSHKWTKKNHQWDMTGFLRGYKSFNISPQVTQLKKQSLGVSS